MRDSRHDILFFWFEEIDPALWFQKNEEFDALVRARFLKTYEMVNDGLCQDWTDNADGALAMVLVLDQFPRNMFRGQPRAFASDNKALLTSKSAIAKGFDQILPSEKRRFLYMPFMHSEKLNDQIRSVELFAKMKDIEPLSYDYAIKHKDVIERFDRFPHRNEILGRENTPEEQDYLDKSGIVF